jgi:prepilin-type N-terminal cleavage/methylation domain-containing protein
MKSKKAFTLIELLVVIAIIGALATIAVVALNNARAKGRDAARVADIKQIQTALELYFNDKNHYPTAAEFNSSSIFSTSTNGTTTYMMVVPTAANPPDGGCNANQNSFAYTPSSDGTSYTISFCTGNTVGSLASGGPKCATPGGMLNADCSGGGGGGLLSCLDDPTGCDWQNVGASGFSAIAGSSVSSFVYNGTPYVAYNDSTNSNKATVMKYDGSSWVNVGNADFSSGFSGDTSLFIYDGTPYVAYSDFGGSNSGQVTVMKFDH